MRFLSVYPAYGRAYISIDTAIADWRAGKDFKIPQGPYVSIDDTAALVAEGYAGVAIQTLHGYHTVALSKMEPA